MHEPRFIRGLPLATLVVIAAAAMIASVARWRAAASVPAGTLRHTVAATGLRSGAAPAHPVIAPPERADAPTASSNAPLVHSDAPSAPSDPPRLPPRVEAHARAAVDRYITDAGLEDAVSGVDREALVMALAQVRASSLWQRRHAHARDDAESRRRQSLLDADRVFRDTLGVGVGEFVTALAPPGTIEDLGAARQ